MAVFVKPREYDIPRELSVGFTGHRPDRLPWGRDENSEECLRFKKRLEDEIIGACRAGARYFLSGMADGFDLIAAEAVLGLADRFPDIRLVAVFPYGTGSSPRKRAAAERAAFAISMFESYDPDCYRARNRFIVDHSARMICCFGGDARTGTGHTVRMALSAGLEMRFLMV